MNLSTEATRSYEHAVQEKFHPNTVKSVAVCQGWDVDVCFIRAANGAYFVTFYDVDTLILCSRN